MAPTTGSCEITEPDGILLAFLRSGLGLTGAKEGCGEGACGACTVLVDGAPVLACRTRAGDMAGRSVITIEGLAGPAGQPLHPVQRALDAERAAQCGYCTPGVALRAAALLSVHPDPGDDQIAAALDPCVCRCGCYPRIIRAVHRAARLRVPPDFAPAATSVPPVSSVLARPSRPRDLSEPPPRTRRVLTVRCPRPRTPSPVSRTSTNWRMSPGPTRSASGSITSMTSDWPPCCRPRRTGSAGPPTPSRPDARPGGTASGCGTARAWPSAWRRAAQGRIARPSLSGYRVPRFTDVPDLDVVLLDRPHLPSAGAGEMPLIAVRSPGLTSSRPQLPAEISWRPSQFLCGGTSGG